ncbi:MAG: HAMP domain-containing sensor histidine kinase, partial [Fulvivirga sp.]
LLESRQRMQNILFASMSTIIILLAFLAFMYYRNNKRKQMLNMIITERKEEVEAQRDQLEAMNETREKFLSIIAHDLLGPVNSFKGFSTIMKFSIDQNDTEDLKQIHSQFEKSVDGLSSLLTNLLDWSVTQQGTIPYKPEKVELKTLVDELVNLFKNMADTKNIEIKSTIDTDVDMWVDVNSVKTILRNLVSNAIKFTVDGGSITISAQTDGSMVSVKVQDTGIGIPQEKLATLLGENNFNRSWGTKGEKGLGLGLQLVKEFTEINKGELAIESVEGKGTSISVTLPLFRSKTQQ